MHLSLFVNRGCLFGSQFTNRGPEIHRLVVTLTGSGDTRVFNLLIRNTHGEGLLRSLQKTLQGKCLENCKCSLKTGGFFMKNDKYYCQKDYQKISTPRCKICGEVLVGDIVSALSYSFHKGCFICSHCKTPFSPGNRVTIWKDEFYCVCCSQTVCTRQSSSGCKSRPTSPLSFKQDQKRHNGNGVSSTTVPKQPLKQAQQQNQNQPTHRLSFADHPSPISFAESGSGTENNGGRVSYKSNGSILKSSLRQSHTMQPAIPSTTNSDHPDYIKSTHSPPKVSATLPTESSVKEQFSHPNFINSHTLGTQHTQSLHGSFRHGLSEYGRFYNLSYASMAEQPGRRSTDIYRRHALQTPATSNSTSRLQHFHIPQGSRFTLEPTRIVPAGLSRNSRSLNTGLRDALTAQYSSASSGRLASSVSNGGGGCPDSSRHSTLVVESEAASLEARRLASFPAGQPPDASSVPAIERYDWPAPASTAVMTAELMRERRQRLREQGVLAASSDESVEDLSIDTSIGSHNELDGVAGGIGRAILIEEERARRRKARTLNQLLDPVSASRSPNAKVEPSYKTRYDTHNFAYNSTGLRPGYTAGQLSLGSSKTSSIPGPHCFLSPGLDASHNGYAANGEINGNDPVQSQLSPIRMNGVRNNESTANSSRDFNTSLLDSAPSYPSVVSSTPLTVPMKRIEENPIKEFPYKDLLASLGRPPKGVDRTRLEFYLSDAEFQKVFKLSRAAFYRLPEWKRNDLKRRVDLF
nr:actin binding lim protein 1 [Hymenolepis microstoma]